MLEIVWPWMFLLLPLPLLVFLLVPAAKREDAALRVPFFHRAESALSGSTSLGHRRELVRLMVLCVMWFLLVIAATKPQWVGDPISLPSSGRDLLVAVDISGSMETPDMVVEKKQIPRIYIVKYVIGDFLERRLNDRVGLILFGSQAYLQSPLTFDRVTVNRLLQEAQLGFAGKQTAIGDAIGLAIKRLKDRPTAQRVVILLTDGANTAGEVDPKQAADLAQQAGVKIYTIGVGADEMVQHIGPFAKRVNPSQELDEETLRYIATTTGGQYFRARDPEDLNNIYGRLDALEPMELEDETYRPTKPLYYWPLALGFILSLLLASGLCFSKGAEIPA